MSIVYMALAGLLLDLLLGDPAALSKIHPVVLLGKLIASGEKMLRRLFPDDRRGQLTGGVLLAVLLPVATFVVSWGLLFLLRLVWPPLALALQVVWCWQALAVKDLRQESMKVYRQLNRGSLEQARQAVSRIVGRDTGALSAEGVTKATVETVAENFADGVVAPLFYMLLGGAPLALAYKAVNTMDSMIGYKNETYLYFGRAAAKTDDALNFLPARLGALFLLAAAALLGQDEQNGWRVWRRDRLNHSSPNSAQCESVMAGVLHLRLGGPACYFGQIVEKPYIGDDQRPALPRDIPTACSLMYGGSILAAALFCLLRAGVFALLAT